MRWVLEPGIGVGPIVLGGDAKQLIELFSERAETFKRVPSDEVTIRAYDQSGFHLGVDPAGRVSFVTIFQPNELIVSGVSVLGRPILDVVAELRQRQVEMQEVEAGAWVKVGNMSVTLVSIDGVIDGVEVTRAD
jgi:hypothetical protein